MVSFPNVTAAVKTKQNLRLTFAVMYSWTELVGSCQLYLSVCAQKENDGWSFELSEDAAPMI